jgi:hypothetical protein
VRDIICPSDIDKADKGLKTLPIGNIVPLLLLSLET